MKTDTQIKTEATKLEKKRVFDHMLKPKDIFVECSDGSWVKRACPLGNISWTNWEKLN